MNNEVIKAFLDANIYPNGNEEVSATMVNDVISNVISHFGGGYVFGGMITPTSSPNANSDVNTFYLSVTSADKNIIIYIIIKVNNFKIL